MEHKKDIGKAFREKLDHLDKMPGDHVWAAIEADLPEKKKRRMLPFWLFFASLMILSTLYFGTDVFEGTRFSRSVGNRNESGNENDINKSSELEGTKGANGSKIQSPAVGSRTTNDGSGLEDDNTNNQFGPTKNVNLEDSHNDVNGGGTKSTTKTVLNSKVKKQVASKNRTKKRGGIAGKNGESILIGATASENKPTINSQNIKENKVEGDDFISGNPLTKNDTTLTAKDTVPKITTLKETPKKKPKDSTQTVLLEEDDYKTFSIFLYVAPTYYSRFSQISSIDNSLDSISGTAEITYNYGGYLGFVYDETWSFRVGIAKTDLKYVTKDVPVGSLDTGNYYNVDYAGGTDNEAIAAQFANSARFDILQEVSYLEFPIELKYKLYNKAISIEGIGGISTLFLKENTVTAQSSSGSVVMGSTKNLSKAYFSANLGIGFSYRILDDFKLNIEPMFKYHFRTASTALQPYSVLIQGGIEYTFNSRNKKKIPKK